MAEGALRFRRDLEASNVEADGVLYVEVSDPRSGKSFRFYDFEYAVALKLDGRPLDAVAAELRQNELELSVEQLAAFADQLSGLGFVEQAPTFFPPLSEDESGEWSSPAIRALSPAAAARPPATPAPPAFEDLAEPTPGPPPALSSGPGPFGKAADFVAPLGEGAADQARSPAPAPRSLSEHTYTSFPPPTGASGAGNGLAADGAADDDDYAAGAGSGKTEPGLGINLPLPELKTPVPAASDAAEIEAATTEPGSPRFTPSAPSAAAAGFARDEGGGSEATVADLRPPSAADLDAPGSSAPQIEAALKNATDSLEDLSSLLAPEKAAESLATSPVTDKGAAAAKPDPLAGIGTGPAPSDRRELPTKRLRAVSDTSAEEPGVPVEEPGPIGTIPGASPRAPAAPAAQSAALGKTPVDSPSLRPRDVGRLPSWLAYAAMGIFAAIIVSVMIYKFKLADGPPPVTVKVIVPTPTTVYRFWDTSGMVERAEGTAFAFASAGKVMEVAATGASFAAGDIIGLLEGGKRFRTDLLHNQDRLAYYEQQREKMVQENNRPEIRQAEIKVAEKKRLIAEAQGNLAKHSIVAMQAGEVAESLVTAGDTVKEGQPVLRVKGSTYRASFPFAKEEAEKARQLGFCRVEIDGKALDCSLSAEGGDETHVVIDLPSDDVVATGKSVRLARDRLDGVFPLPASVVERVGDSDRLYVVVGKNAELRGINVADRTASEVVVSQGIDVGDRVILDRPAGLKHDARVLISETVSR